MDKQRQDDQLKPIYSSSVPIQDVVLKTSREWWTLEMGGERGSGRFWLAAQNYNDDDDDAMSFKVLDQLCNLTPVWKCVEIPFVSCLKNLKRVTFIICLHTKQLFHYPRHDFAIFCWIYQNVDYFPAIIWKGKANKVFREALKGCYFVSTIGKHSVLDDSWFAIAPVVIEQEY